MREGRRGAARGETTVLLGVARVEVGFARARRQNAPAGEEDADDAGAGRKGRHGAARGAMMHVAWFMKRGARDAELSGVAFK